MTDTDSLMKRCEALEAEQKRVAAQLEAVTRKLDELKEAQNEIVMVLTEIQRYLNVIRRK